MAGLSYPFDDGPGSTITEDQWSFMMRDGIGTGVHEADPSSAPKGNGLEVFSLEEVGIVRVRAGRATINGFHYQQSGTEVIAVTANANATLSRIDAVVLRLDLETNVIALEAKQGVPASSPVPPALDANEMLLGTYRVRPSTSTVLSDEVEDGRVFVGRRLQLAHRGFVGNPGDMGYDDFAARWYGVTDEGFIEYFALTDEITAHTGAVDPHPQYTTLSEVSEIATTSNLTLSPLVTANAAYCRAINFPGGHRLVHLYFYGNYGGTDNPGNFTLFTIQNPSYRPSVTFRVAGHQYEFANSTDDIPLVVRINTTGDVSAGGDTFLMGGAQILLNTMWWVGSGV